MRPTLRPLETLGLLALAATPGCCDLAAYFCGPDKSDWVPISYETPKQALATFMEAVRRDHVRVICESLSLDYRREMGLPGCFEAALVWEKIREQTPGAHMLGRADITGPEIVVPRPPAQAPPERVRYVLEIAGYRVSVDLQRYAYAGARYRRPGENEQPLDDYVPSLEPLVDVRHGPGSRSTVSLRVPDLELPQGADIVGVSAGYEWKVRDVRQIAE